MHSDGGVALLPNVPITIKTKKSTLFDLVPRTLAEHLWKQRMMLILTQEEASGLIGANTETYQHWEKGYTEPEIESIPAIVRFLGYDPFPPPKTLQERMLAKRRGMGWTLKMAAAVFEVNRKTWKSWERGESVPGEQSTNLLERFLVEYQPRVIPEIHWPGRN